MPGPPIAVATDMRITNTYIGSPIERIEDLRFLRGKGEYVDDLKRDGLLHASFVRSSVAHGIIRAIDGAAALDLPGVHSVITAADIGDVIPMIPLRQEPLPALRRFEQPVIASDRVRYVGEAVAVVLADSPALAEDGADLVRLDIDPLPVIADRASSAREETLLFDENGTNSPITLTAVLGDADAAFRDAPYVRRESFSVQRYTAVTMEARGLLAEWDADSGRMTVSGAVKVPFAIRRVLAAQMGLDEAQIDILENDAGGGFGVRGEFYPEDFLIPFAARLTGRSVKWIEDRREHMTASNHARDAECELEIACERDGTIRGLRGRAVVDLGAYMRTNAVTPARNIVQVASGPYRIPNVHIEAALQMTNKTPVGTYRGPGRFETDFFRERLFDMAAGDLGIDRVAFRRRNLLTSDEMPYSLPTVLPYDMNTECDSGEYSITLDRCLEMIGWDAKADLQGQLIDGRYHGFGVGCYIEGGASGPREHVRLALEDDGRVAVYVGSSAVGQGLETVHGQIAADALEFPMDRLTGVFHGSTTYLKEGFGTYSSRSVVMGGSALVLAADDLRASIRAAAAQRLGCAADEVDIIDGERAETPAGASVPLGELADAVPDAETSFSSNKRTYSYGAHAAHVAVDPKTGHVAVLDYVAVEDVGRIINPKTLHGQAIGAIVQGLGGTLLEHLVYDEGGQLLSGTLADYLMPTMSDFPTIRVE
ncbi:MAG: xanthine dehydrogenase family protein molybdopterin-binding subunit, partial [Alphaproteobacteria bacterium]